MPAETLPDSRPITSVSPTRSAALVACALHVAYSQHGQGQAPRSPQQVLGDVSHEVLEALVTSGAIRGHAWQDEIEPLWQAICGRVARPADPDPRETWRMASTPAGWPGYAIKRARLTKAAGRLHDLLMTADASAGLISETPMSTADGRLQGRPDLIVRDPSGSWVVDFKSGAVLEGPDQAPREAYVRQLHLYALLEAATSGRWPSRAFLLPLSGPVVEIPLDRAHAEMLLDEALAAVDAFNARVPGPQPGSPAPQTCRYCPWSTACPEMWHAVDKSWAEQLTAVCGLVTRAAHTQLGGVTITLEVAAGSLTASAISIRAVSPVEHPSVAPLKPGDQVAVVGLRQLHDSDEFALPTWGRLALRTPTS